MYKVKMKVHKQTCQIKKLLVSNGLVYKTIQFVFTDQNNTLNNKSKGYTIPIKLLTAVTSRFATLTTANTKIRSVLNPGRYLCWTQFRRAGSYSNSPQ